jgi:hypothetical protein
MLGYHQVSSSRTFQFALFLSSIPLVQGVYLHTRKYQEFRSILIKLLITKFFLLSFYGQPLTRDGVDIEQDRRVCWLAHRAKPAHPCRIVMVVAHGKVKPKRREKKEMSRLVSIRCSSVSLGRIHASAVLGAEV